METLIDNKGVHLDFVNSDRKILNESQKIKFLVVKYLLGATGKFRLGFAWVVLEPLLVSLIYVFLFSVIRSDISGELIIYGIGSYGVFSNSIRAGMDGLSDSNGGFTAERISTSALLKSQIIYSVIEGCIQAISILILLYIAMDTQFPGALTFIVICPLIAVISRTLGFNLVLFLSRTPDMKHIFNFFLRLGFFVSPVLYPFDSCEGLHKQFNELNPVSHIIELSRYLSGAIDSFVVPSHPLQIIVILTTILLSLRGVAKLDTYRWEVSTWN